MTQELHGLKIQATDRESLRVYVQEGKLYLETRNINGSSTGKLFDKPVGISDEQIVSDFASFFKSHNENVIDNFVKLKKGTIQKVVDYYSEKTAKELKEEFENKIQKNVFDVSVGKKYGTSEFVSFNTGGMLLFESEKDTPIVFDLAEEEYNLLENYAKKFNINQ